jgi:hypothetical protein
MAMASLSRISISLAPIVTPSIASRTSSWLNNVWHGLLVEWCEPTALPEEPTGCRASKLPVERADARTLLIKSNTCFSMWAAGTRATDPASGLRALSKARET